MKLQTLKMTTNKTYYLEQLLVLAPLAGPPFRHGGLLVHLPSAAWTPLPSQPPRSHLIDNRGPLTPGALSRTPYSQEDGERLFPRPNCHFTYLAHSQNVSFPACKKDVLWWLVSKLLVAGDYQQLILAFPLPALFILTSRPCPNSIRPVRREDQALWRCLGIRHESIDSAIK